MTTYEDAMSQLPERISRKIALSDSGCWTWAKLNWAGYGVAVGYQGKKHVLPHRLTYMIFVGPIPEGLDLDHLCRNRACVNPEHLEPVTRSENLRRSPLMGRHNHLNRGAECRHGHPRTPQNIYTAPDGSQTCRPCRNEASRRYMARKEGRA